MHCYSLHLEIKIFELVIKHCILSGCPQFESLRDTKKRVAWTRKIVAAIVLTWFSGSKMSESQVGFSNGHRLHLSGHKESAFASDTGPS